jgi:hypothetical protein
VRHLAPILEKLAKAKAEFCRAADAIECKRWKTKPSANEWSAAEVVAHLITVERTIVGGADRVTQKLPEPVPFLKRMHLPLWLVESRIVKRESPLPLNAALLQDKEEMLGELRATRERTVAFLQETDKRDLRKYHWPHPFLGMLNVYEWFEMIAAHQVRHTKQVLEIAERLPKLVGISQN